MKNVGNKKLHLCSQQVSLILSQYHGYGQCYIMIQREHQCTFLVPLIFYTLPSLVILMIHFGNINFHVKGREEDNHVICIFPRYTESTVWRNGLWLELWDMGVKGKIWRVRKCMYPLRVQSCWREKDLLVFSRELHSL